jgi:hypothetical protein
LGIATRDQRLPFHRSAIIWVAIWGVFAPTAMQSVSDRQANAPSAAGKEAAGLDVTALGRAVVVEADAAPAATGTVIAAAATITPRVMANRVRDAKSLTSRDLSTVITIRRRIGRSHELNAAQCASLLSPCTVRWAPSTRHDTQFLHAATLDPKTRH